MLERFRPSRVLALVAALLALGATHLASALQTRSSNTPRAEVEITYPMPRVVVGDVFAITFGITNASTIEEPRVPSVPGLRSQVRQTHGSSFEGTLNGRKIRQSSVGFDVLFVAEQPGTYELPRARIVVDGLTYESKPFTVEVLGFDTSSSVRAELIASPQSPVVGQNLSIRLRVWLKPFRTGRLGFGVDQQWNHSIKARESRWGIFQGAAEQYYRDLRWRIPPRVERDEDGGEWYVYELEASASADRPGPLDLGEIELRVGVQRANGGERQFSIVPTPPPIVVEPVPTEGRPADFTGAVGDFEFEARVKPSRAGVGDPMTLTLVVVDRTPGGADLARLLPPSLVEQPELARSFRVPDEPLAGTVNGRTKVFTQTIRPLSERVTDVPALSFSFFDPAEREF
ncbi:MAG: protein BatD, partial [Phycisphaerae bacterium]|nr:protein BatD [Phycisphaerae bacterium]